MYAEGRGVPKNIVSAYVWLNVGETNGILGAKEVLNNLSEKMTASQIAEAQTRSAKCFASDYKNC